MTPAAFRLLGGGQEKLAIEQTSGLSASTFTTRLIWSPETRMIEVETVDAASTIQLLESIEALYPILVLIHVFLDNARDHQAKLVRDWIVPPEYRFKPLMSEAIL